MPSKAILGETSFQTRKIEGKLLKKFGFSGSRKSGYRRKPQNEPQGILNIKKRLKKLEKSRISCRNPG